MYLIKCKYCGDLYIGETGRSAYDRLSEHFNYARNVKAKSYQKETMAIHYNTRHPNLEPSLEFRILTIEHYVLTRKIKEAYYIEQYKPSINRRNELECMKVEKYLFAV